MGKKNEIRVIVAGLTGQGKSTIIQILTDALAAHGITTGFKLAHPTDILYTGDPYCPPEMQAKRIAEIKEKGVEVLIEERFMYQSLNPDNSNKIAGVTEIQNGPVTKVVE